MSSLVNTVCTLYSLQCVCYTHFAAMYALYYTMLTLMQSVHTMHCNVTSVYTMHTLMHTVQWIVTQYIDTHCTHVVHIYTLMHTALHRVGGAHSDANCV